MKKQLIKSNKRWINSKTQPMILRILIISKASRVSKDNRTISRDSRDNRETRKANRVSKVNKAKENKKVSRDKADLREKAVPLAALDLLAAPVLEVDPEVDPVVVAQAQEVVTSPTEETTRFTPRMVEKANTAMSSMIPTTMPARITKRTETMSWVIS